jgi:hypothetical protein
LLNFYFVNYFLVFTLLLAACCLLLAACCLLLAACWLMGAASACG